MATKQQKIGIAIAVAGGIAVYYFVVREPTTYHYITLPSSVSQVLYDGARINTSKAISTLEGDAIIWWQDQETGEWLFYDGTFPQGSTLAYLEHDEVYAINLMTVWPQDWMVPDYK